MDYDKNKSEYIILSYTNKNLTNNVIVLAFARILVSLEKNSYYNIQIQDYLSKDIIFMFAEKGGKDLEIFKHNLDKHVSVDLPQK